MPRAPTPAELEKLEAIFALAGCPVPAALDGWPARLDVICAEYEEAWPDAHLVEFRVDAVVTVFDLTAERAVCVYGVSTPPAAARDTARMAGFPDVNVGWRRSGRTRVAADKGHFLAHGSGGGLDANLFPQARDLNRGWSQQGKVYRSMERTAAAQRGTFVYHRAIYADATWVPRELEYGLLRPDGTWWLERFSNA